MSTSTGEPPTSQGALPLSREQGCGDAAAVLRRGGISEEGGGVGGNPFLLMSQDQMLKLDAVLSPEQVRALLQETSAPPAASTASTDKLDFDDLGHVGHAEDGGHALGTIDDTFRDLETLVLEQGTSPGLFAGTTDADVEALLKATLGSEELSAIDLVLLDHSYSLPHSISPAPEEDEEEEEEDASDEAADEEEPLGGSAGGSEVGSPGSPMLPLRRSQRQIEKIDRERLERIKAENAELKRREQEEMERSRSAAAPGLPVEAGVAEGDPPAPPPVAVVPVHPPTSPAAARTLPVTAHDKSLRVSPQLVSPQLVSPQLVSPQLVSPQLVSPQLVSPIKRTKVRSSDSLSSEGTGDEVSSPTAAAVADGHPPQRKRTKAEDEEKRGTKRSVEALPQRSKKEQQRAKKEAEEAASPAKRKAESSGKEVDAVPKSKKKKTVVVLEQPEDNSPFGKVVKVVRAPPEQQKKRVRRESCGLSDEPALFSQPDVLMKEGETPTTAASMAAKEEASMPNSEAPYDSVEAHVARLAGLEMGEAAPGVSKQAAATNRQPPPPTVVSAVAAKAVPVPKPTVPTSEVTTPKKQPMMTQPKQEPRLERKKSMDGVKPVGTKTEGSKSFVGKPDGIRPAGAKPDGARPVVVVKQDAVKQVAVKSAATVPKTGDKTVGVPRQASKMTKGLKVPPRMGKVTLQADRGDAKPANAGMETPKKAKPEPMQSIVVSDRPLRQSKEKFKRAMMRKREMGRRVDDEDVEEDEDPEDQDWSSEDDPERLWCICRQPHNDKFMIQCDRCEDWFHGHCVGVTRQQGRLWEKEGREWACPRCLKDAKRGGGGAVVKKEKPEKAVPKAPKAEPQQPKQKGTIRECLVCKQETECTGLYCGRECIAKYVNDATQTIKAAKLEGERRLMFTERGSGKLVPGVSVPTPEKLTEWLVRNPTYELAVARMAPPLPKAAPSKAPPSAPKAAPAQRPQPAPGNAQTKAAVTASKAAGQAKQGGNSTKVPPVVNKTSGQPQGAAKVSPPTVDVVGGNGSTENGSTEKSNSIAAAVPAPQPEPEPPKKQEIEPVRISVRKMLRDSLSNRCKEADDIALSGDEVKRIAVKIEEELFKYFRDTGTKYKSRYRSLVFNIKDTRNQGLVRKILRGKITPDKLVRMTPEELASKELAKWRERENQHALEMIKKEQMEAAQTSHAHLKKTHKGEVEIDDDNNLSLLEKGVEKAVAEPPEAPTSASGAGTGGPRVSVGGGTGTTGAVAVDSDRQGRDTTDAHRSHLFDLNCKICTGKVAAPPAKGPEEDLVTASPPRRPPEVPGGTSPGGSTPPPPPPASHSSSKKGGESKHKKAKDDSDHEPSSTVSLGSPDSAVVSSGSKRLSQPKTPASVWKGFISMQEVSKFVTSAYKVSGPTDFLAQDIPDTINVCGRIIPDQVWDYLSKIKQSGNKELLVIRFQPANDEEKRPYKDLYSYLNSRKRCGVVGGLSRMLKDFYIHPLPANSPVPTVLTPFDGPGLMPNRPNLLLGVIIRHKSRPKGSGKPKSSWSADRSEPSYTPPPEGGGAEASDDDEPYEPSYTPPLEKRPKRASPTSAVPATTTAEDDEPYDPEDNDFGAAADASGSRDSSGPGGPPGSLLSGQAVSDLIERISAGANPAEVTSSVLASLASNADLEHQKRLLMELTQEVEEQKRLIELQRQQAIRMAMGRTGTTATAGAVAVVPSPPAGEPSGIPFLDSSVTATSTGLSFLSTSGGTKDGALPAASGGACSLPSTLQELLNKVKAPAQQATPTPPLVATPPQLAPAAKKPIADDPIVKHFAREETPDSDVEVAAGSETPPPPGVGLKGETAVDQLPSSSPGTPTKDELVVEDARPQDPRRRKAAVAMASAVPSLAVPSVPQAATPASPQVPNPMSASTSTLGAKSASELMEMARKQLEEMEGMAPPPQQTPAVYNPAVAPPAVGTDPPQQQQQHFVPPPMMQGPPPRMFGPPPGMDGGMGFVPPPPQGPMLPPPTDQQWGAGPGGEYWKGGNWGGGGDWGRGGNRGRDWRGGRRGWDQRH